MRNGVFWNGLLQPFDFLVFFVAFVVKLDDFAVSKNKFAEDVDPLELSSM